MTYVGVESGGTGSGINYRAFINGNLDTGITSGTGINIVEIDELGNV